MQSLPALTVCTTMQQWSR